jgi:phage tail-like protein
VTDLFARAFKFQVTLSESPKPGGSTNQNAAKLSNGAFQECSGLDLELDVGEYVEGGRNNGVLQRTGRAKVTRIVLRRGMFYRSGARVDPALWRWFQDVADGVRPLRRYDGTIDLLGEAQDVVASWAFVRGLPAKLVGPQLNGKTGELAVEEMQIAHEGLRMLGVT